MELMRILVIITLIILLKKSGNMRSVANVLVNMPKGMSSSEVLGPELRNFTVLHLHVRWTFCNKAHIKALRKEALRGSQI